MVSAATAAEALLIIGTLESGLVWNHVDYVRNISCGIAAWAGGTAARLLSSLDAADQDTLESSLRADLAAHASTDAEFWNNRFLNKDEANSIIDALGTATAETSQRAFFADTLDAYESIMSTWGCDAGGTLAQQRAFIFYAAIYHADFVTAASICSAIGGQASPDSIYNALMNKPTAATLRAWGTARDALNAWQGTEPTVQGDTGQPWTDPGSPGDGQTIITQVESQIQRIGMTGQQIIVYGEDNQQGIVCVRETDSLWLPIMNTAAPPTPTPIDPPTPVDPPAPGDFAAMRQLWYDNENNWAYGGGAGRLDPVASGYTDCSGCIWWAVNKVRPDIAEGLGDFTEPMARAGVLIQEGTLDPNLVVDPSILQEGDIVLVSKNGYYSSGGDSHVEWWFGDNAGLWGAGRAPLPHHSADTVQGYLRAVASGGRYAFYMIRRFL